MKSLVFNHVGLWHRHIAECTEVALRQLDMGHDVIFLSCKGALLGCPANPHRDKKRCRQCVTRTEKVEKNLSALGVIILTLPDTEQVAVSPSLGGDLTSLAYKEMPVGRLVHNTVVTISSDMFFDQADELISPLVHNAINLFEVAGKLITQEGVDHVFVWNGRRSCDGPILYAAKKLNIKYSAFVTHGSDFSVIVVDDVLAHSLHEARKNLCSTHKKIDAEGDWKSATVSASKYYAFASGHGDFKPSFGFFNDAKNYTPDPNAFHRHDSRKKLAIYIGTNTEFAGLPGYSSALDKMYGNFYEAVKAICLDADITDKYQIVVRWHPNSATIKGNEYSLFCSTVDVTASKVRHILPADLSSSYDLLDQCDLVISIGSSMAVEALYNRKRCIFIGNNIFDEFSFFRPSSHVQLKSYLFNEHTYDFEVAYRQSLVFAHYLLEGGTFKFRFLKPVSTNCGYQYFTSAGKIISEGSGFGFVRSFLLRLGLLTPFRSLKRFFSN